MIRTFENLIADQQSRIEQHLTDDNLIFDWIQDLNKEL